MAECLRILSPLVTPNFPCNLVRVLLRVVNLLNSFNFSQKGIFTNQRRMVVTIKYAISRVQAQLILDRERLN